MRGDGPVTNEELAILIQNGDEEYLPVLWEQVRRLIRMRAEQYYRKFRMNGGCNYAVDAEDLAQNGYYAVLNAVKYYSSDTGYTFTTYLDKPLRNAFGEALAIRSSKRDPSLTACSLDAGCGEDEVPLINLIDSHDCGLQQAERRVYNQELHRVLSEILQQLPVREREVLTFHFFFGLSYKEQAANKGIRSQSVSLREKFALERIRRNPEYMKRLSEFYI